MNFSAKVARDVTRAKGWLARDNGETREKVNLERSLTSRLAANVDDDKNIDRSITVVKIL